jgi:hypothetical protein
MPDTPLRPDELETYKTDVLTAAEEPDPALPTPGGDSRPWVGLGIVLLVLFLVVLVAAIVMTVT